MLLNITPTIRNEWLTRGIADVVPALESLPWDTQSVIEVDDKTAAAILADCEFYIDPKAVDATVGTRSAYRALKTQINAAQVTPAR